MSPHASSLTLLHSSSLPGFVVLIVILCLIIVACCGAAFYLYRSRRASSGRRTAPASTSQYKYSSTTSEPKSSWKSKMRLPFFGKSGGKEGWVQANSGDDWDTRSLHEEPLTISTDESFVPPANRLYSPYTPPDENPFEPDGRKKPTRHYSSADSYRRSGSFSTLDLYAPGGPLSGAEPNLRDNTPPADLITDRPRTGSPAPLHIDTEALAERPRRDHRTISTQSAKSTATFSGGTKFIEDI